MHNVLDVVLLGIHALLLLLRPQGRVGLIHLVNDVLSTLEVDGSFKVLGAVRLANNRILQKDVLREGRLFTGHIMQLEVDSSFEGVKELGDYGIVAHLDASVCGLGQPVGLLGLLRHHVIEMVVDRQLSQGVEVGGVWPGVGKHSDSSHADLLRLNLVLYQGKDNWPVEDRIPGGCFDQLVYSHRAGMGVTGGTALHCTK